VLPVPAATQTGQFAGTSVAAATNAALGGFTVPGGSVSSTTVIGATQVNGSALSFGSGAVPPGAFENIGQGVDVSGNLQLALAGLANLNPTQAALQQNLVSVSSLLNPTGFRNLGGPRSGGGGGDLGAQPDFRGLDGVIGLAPQAGDQSGLDDLDLRPWAAPTVQVEVGLQEVRPEQEAVR
jgi:hypothetical protein